MAKSDFMLLKDIKTLAVNRFALSTEQSMLCRHREIKGFYVSRSNPDGLSSNWWAPERITGVDWRIVPLDDVE